MSNIKIQLNDAQVALAKSWLPDGSQPYAYDGRFLWYWLSWYGQPVKNAIRLSSDQSTQLDQLR